MYPIKEKFGKQERSACLLNFTLIGSRLCIYNHSVDYEISNQGFPIFCARLL